MRVISALRDPSFMWSRQSILICASRPLILQVIGHDPAAVKAEEHEEQAEAEEEEEEAE